MPAPKNYASMFGATYVVFDNYTPEQLKKVPDGTKGWWQGNVIELQHGDPETSPTLTTPQIKADAQKEAQQEAAQKQDDAPKQTQAASS